jgi:hypothetical protein
MKISTNLGSLGALLIAGGGALWVLDLLVLSSLDMYSSEVLLAALGTMAVVLPAVVLLGVIALVVGAALTDRADAMPAATFSAPATGSSSPSIAEDLARLAELHQNGAITESEYEAGKARAFQT